MAWRSRRTGGRSRWPETTGWRCATWGEPGRGRRPPPAGVKLAPSRGGSPMDQIECPTCSSRLSLPFSVIGREVKCPRCQGTFVARLDMALGPRLGNVSYASLTSGEGAEYAWKEGA